MRPPTIYDAWRGSDRAADLWSTLPPLSDPHDPLQRGRRMRQFQRLLCEHHLAAERPLLTGMGRMDGLAAALRSARERRII
jgi:hypothetical protein